MHIRSFLRFTRVISAFSRSVEAVLAHFNLRSGMIYACNFRQNYDLRHPMTSSYLLVVPQIVP